MAIRILGEVFLFGLGGVLWRCRALGDLPWRTQHIRHFPLLCSAKGLGAQQWFLTSMQKAEQCKAHLPLPAKV
jgi:hypothetical protein